MSYSGQRVVVAGGAGFVGAHLTRALMAEGAEVVVIDNYHTALEESLSPSDGLPIIRANIVDPVEVDGAVDTIFNLACPASPVHYQADPISTWRTSVFGTNTMVEMAHAKTARIVQASTSEVYGDPLETPQREGYRGNTSTTGPRACYDEGKRAAVARILAGRSNCWAGTRRCR